MTEYHIKTALGGAVTLSLDGNSIATFSGNNTGKHFLALCLEALGRTEGVTVVNDDTGNVIVGDAGQLAP